VGKAWDAPRPPRPRGQGRPAWDAHLLQRRPGPGEDQHLGVLIVQRIARKSGEASSLGVLVLRGEQDGPAEGHGQTVTWMGNSDTDEPGLACPEETCPEGTCWRCKSRNRAMFRTITWMRRQPVCSAQGHLARREKPGRYLARRHLPKGWGAG